MPLVSIGAVCYNQARFVVETLESIRKQTYPNIQLIIIDDCSTDNSVEVIQNWIDEHHVDCEFVKHEVNLGVTKTCNDGLRRVKGKYYQLIACDDIMMPEKIEKQVEILNTSSDDVAMVFSDAELLVQDGLCYGKTFIQLFRQFKDTPSGWIFGELLEGNYIPAPSVLIKSEVIRQIGNYDEKIGYEDYDMWLRISAQYRIIFDSYISCKYRIHESNMSKKAELIKDSYWIFKKHNNNKVCLEKMQLIAVSLYLNGDHKNSIYKDFICNYISSFNGNKVLRFLFKYRVTPILYKLTISCTAYFKTSVKLIVL